MYIFGGPIASWFSCRIMKRHSDTPRCSRPRPAPKNQPVKCLADGHLFGA